MFHLGRNDCAKAFNSDQTYLEVGKWRDVRTCVGLDIFKKQKNKMLDYIIDYL